MNTVIAQFKADMDAKLAAANARLDGIEQDEAGLKGQISTLQTEKADLEAKIAALEAQGPNLSPEDTAALAELQTSYQALADRIAAIDAAT